MSRVTCRLAVVTGIALCVCLASFADEKGETKGGFKPIAELNLSTPIVDINGPIPTLLREAKVGQLIQVQIRYPIAPPFPQSAEVDLSTRAFSLVGVYNTGGQVAILTPKPQTGGLGVGYLSVFVKAINQGRGTITAQIKLSDGTVKSVPFEFEIK
jgi:hypothetical protein